MAQLKKILSIDGGGVRAIIPAMVLAEIERRTGRPISTLFDLVVGTSSGGILSLGLVKPGADGAPHYAATDGVELFANESARIFSRSTWHKVRSVWSVEEEKYQTTGIEDVLREHFGEALLSEAICDVMVTSYDIERRLPYFFKSASVQAAAAGNDVPQDVPMWQVARATSAAPTYFEPFKIGMEDATEYRALIDAGIFANNPAMCALAEARVLYPKADYMLVSLGTGELTRPLHYRQAVGWGLRQWAQPIIGISFDGTSATVDYQLAHAVEPGRYFRIQTKLTKCNDDMDDASPRNLRAIRLLAEEAVSANKRQLDEICALL